MRNVEKASKLFRSASVVGTTLSIVFAAVIIGTLQKIHLLSLDHLPSLDLEKAIRWELGIQTATVFCLLGFALQALPRCGGYDWIRNDNDPCVKGIFGGMGMRDREQRLQNTAEAATQFRKSWIFLWASWFALYVVWSFAPLPGSNKVVPLTVLGDTLHMVVAAAFFLCYYVMTRHTAPSKKLGFQSVSFFTVTIFAFIGLAGFLFIGQPSRTLDLLHWVNALCAGIFMALFIGRLESALLRINPSIIAVFYIYPIIQVSYPDLLKEQWLFLTMTSVALVLKVLLFWEVRKIICSGTIYWYMFQYRGFYDMGKTDRDNFLGRFQITDTDDDLAPANSCFISYSSKDEEFARRLHADLKSNGVRCWFAPHDVQAGQKLHEQIDIAIRMHEKVLLILSPNSINSEWVKTEIAKARKREAREGKRVLFPIRLKISFEELQEWECFDADRGKDSAREIREYYIPDFSQWKEHDQYQAEFQKLLRDLK